MQKKCQQVKTNHVLSIYSIKNSKVILGLGLFWFYGQCGTFTVSILVDVLIAKLIWYGHDDDDESDRRAIEGGGCKGKCNYWQTGCSSCWMIISYRCTAMITDMIF